MADTESELQQPGKAPRRNRWDTPASSATAAALPQPDTSTAAAAPPAPVAPMAASAAASIAASVLASKEAAKEALARAQLQEDVRRALEQHLPSVQGAAANGEVRQPTTVTIDSQGRLLDERGKVIQSTARPQASIKANQSARANPLLEQEAPPDPKNNKYYDARMMLPGQAREQRKKRAFSFVAEGHFSRKGDDLRAKAAVEQMLAEANKPAAKLKAAASALAAAARAATENASSGAADGSLGGGPTAVSAKTLERRLAEVPGAEWWDLPLLNATSYEGAPGNSLEANLVLEGVTHLIEHPVPIAPPAEPPPPPPMPLPLTKKERKKLRTQRRLAAEKEKQDQIRCGLIQAPPPKVKISNLMSAMKNEAVADPSAVEAKVRAEMAQRVKNHEMRNAARKLTPAERKAKKHRKLTNDPTGGGIPVSVYRIDQMPSQQNLFKIDKNAQQNHLTGILVLMEGCNLLVVEGGPKAQKRYRKLLMHRIDWSDAPAEDEEEDEDDEAKEAKTSGSDVCKVVWEGLVVKAQFRTFRVEAARAVEGARKTLKERGCEHYLDMALRFGTNEEEDEEDSDDDDSDDDDDDEGDATGEAGGEEDDEEGEERNANGAAEGMDVDS